MQNNLNKASSDSHLQDLSKLLIITRLRKPSFDDGTGETSLNDLCSFFRRLRECPPVIVPVKRVLYRPVKTYLSQLRLVDKRLKPLLVKQAKHLKRQLKSDCLRQTLFFSSENSDSSSPTSEPAKA